MSVLFFTPTCFFYIIQFLLPLCAHSVGATPQGASNYAVVLEYRYVMSWHFFLVWSPCPNTFFFCGHLFRGWGILHHVELPIWPFILVRTVWIESEVIQIWTVHCSIKILPVDCRNERSDQLHSLILYKIMGGNSVRAPCPKSHQWIIFLFFPQMGTFIDRQWQWSREI